MVVDTGRMMERFKKKKKKIFSIFSVKYGAKLSAKDEEKEGSLRKVEKRNSHFRE